MWIFSTKMLHMEYQALFFLKKWKHYENTPIQIYGKFHLQKNWKFSDKKTQIFFIFLLKT